MEIGIKVKEFVGVIDDQKAVMIPGVHELQYMKRDPSYCRLNS